MELGRVSIFFFLLFSPRKKCGARWVNKTRRKRRRARLDTWWHILMARGKKEFADKGPSILYFLLIQLKIALYIPDFGQGMTGNSVELRLDPRRMAVRVTFFDGWSKGWWKGEILGIEHWKSRWNFVNLSIQVGNKTEITIFFFASLAL